MCILLWPSGDLWACYVLSMGFLWASYRHPMGQINENTNGTQESLHGTMSGHLCLVILSLCQHKLCSTVLTLRSHRQTDRGTRRQADRNAHGLLLLFVRSATTLSLIVIPVNDLARPAEAEKQQEVQRTRH